MFRHKLYIATGFAVFFTALAPAGAQTMETADQLRGKADSFGRALQLQISQVAKNPPKWQAVSEAPNSFPVPIFREAKTEFLKNPLNTGSKVEFLALRSSQSSSNISKWYEDALGKSGFKLTGSKVNSGGLKLIKGESAQLECNVLISDKAGEGFASSIQLSANPKADRK